MDFKEIKSTWNSSFQDEKLLERGQIEEILKIRDTSNTALSRIKKNTRVSLIALVIMYVMAVPGMLYWLKYPEVIVLILIFSLVMGAGFYFSLYQ